MNEWLKGISPGVVFMWAVCGFAIALMVIVVIWIILIMAGAWP